MRFRWLEKNEELMVNDEWLMVKSEKFFLQSPNIIVYSQVLSSKF